MQWSPTIWPGTPYPLGATYDGAGTNFSLFSEVADEGRAVPDRQGRHRGTHRPRRGRRLRLARYLPTVTPGQRYGFRVHGPWDPPAGHRCDPSKLLLDPYGKSFHGDFDFSQALYSYDLSADDLASGGTPPMIDSLGPHHDQRGDQPVLRLGVRPRARTRPYHETVIYEAHVKGMTQTHPGIPEELRGTYAGLAHPVIIEHLKSLERHRDRADAGAPVHARPPAARPGTAKLLGLQHLRLLRPAPPVRGQPARRRRGRRVQDHGARRSTRRASR